MAECLSLDGGQDSSRDGGQVPIFTMREPHEVQTEIVAVQPESLVGGAGKGIRPLLHVTGLGGEL